MSKKQYYIGIDIAAETFVASVYQEPSVAVMIHNDPFANDPDGFDQCLQWLKTLSVTSSNALICMESTGVYGEALAYYLHAQGFSVAVEPPLKVKRAFEPTGHKTDAVDSKQIAEYAYRFSDEIVPWQPKHEILEKIRQLLATREQLTKQKVALQSILIGYQKYVVQVPLIVKTHRETIDHLTKSIKRIDQELNTLIRQDPDIAEKSNILRSLPGFGMLLATNLMTLSNAFQDRTRYEQLAAHIGIVPYQHQSGTSVLKRARSRGYGPSYARKLLRLAAQSVVTHRAPFRHYYLRKLAEGKAKALVLNNVANKLLRMACSMIKNNCTYTENYKSVHPMVYKLA